MPDLVAILCSGQGGQHPAMFDLVANCPEAEAATETAECHAFASRALLLAQLAEVTATQLKDRPGQ